MMNKSKRFYLISTLLSISIVSSLLSTGYAEEAKEPETAATSKPQQQRSVLIVSGEDSEKLKLSILAQTNLIQTEDIIGDPASLRTTLTKLSPSAFSPISCLAEHSAACASPRLMIFEQLNVQKIIEITTAKDDQGYSAILRIHEGEKMTQQSTFREPTTRSLADAIVRHLFKNTARIVVRSNPPATLWINGQRQPGATPIQASIQSGEITIKLEADGHKSVERTIKAEPNMAYALSYDLPTSISTFQVVNVPKTAQIYLDGKVLGKANKAYPVKEGRYLVEIYAEGFRPYSEYVNITKGTTTTLTTPELTPNEPLYNNFFSLKPIEVRILGNIGWTYNTLGAFSANNGVWLDGLQSGNAQTPSQGTHTGYNGFAYGIGAEISYRYRYFTVLPLSFSLTSSRINSRLLGHLDRGANHKTDVAIAESLTSLRFTILGGGLRYPTKYFVLGANLGFSLHADFLTVAQTQTTQIQDTYSQVYGTMHAEILANIHTNPKYFYTVGSRFEFSLPTNPDRSSFVWALNAGIGFSFDDFLGLQRKPPINLDPSETENSETKKTAAKKLR